MQEEGAPRVSAAGWGQGQQEHSWTQQHARLWSVPRIQGAACLLCQWAGRVEGHRQDACTGRGAACPGNSAAQPCRIEGMWEDAAGSGAAWHSSGAPGPAAASLECGVMPAWATVGRELRGSNAGCCQLGSHKGVPRGAARHERHRLRGAAGQGAAISGDKVLPVPGAGCCRPKAQRAVRRAQRSRRDGAPDEGRCTRCTPAAPTRHRDARGRTGKPQLGAHTVPGEWLAGRSGTAPVPADARRGGRTGRQRCRTWVMSRSAPVFSSSLKMMSGL